MVGAIGLDDQPLPCLLGALWVLLIVSAFVAEVVFPGVFPHLVTGDGDFLVQLVGVLVWIVKDDAALESAPDQHETDAGHHQEQHFFDVVSEEILQASTVTVRLFFLLLGGLGRLFFFCLLLFFGHRLCLLEFPTSNCVPIAAV